jgi:ATP-binding protein involved in chromosome partitioning
MAWLSALLGKKSKLTPAQTIVSSEIVPHKIKAGLTRIAGVKNIIAVGSGKGGVGKSTTSVNLALALQSLGARVGILDADVFGPSIPKMLGIEGQPITTDGKTMEPMQGHGIQAMSIGFMVEEDSPMIWRGPIVTQTLMQLLTETRWKDLDYLILDLPPGTGDTQLTMAQKIPVVAAVIVTTPQDVALLDAQKGLKMFEKVDLPILGIIENMSGHVCSKCGHVEPIFGEGGGQKMAQKYGVELLGQLPLESAIRRHADQGRPHVLAEPESLTAQRYLGIAHRLHTKLSELPRDYSGAFGKIETVTPPAQASELK